MPGFRQAGGPVAHEDSDGTYPGTYPAPVVALRSLPATVGAAAVKNTVRCRMDPILTTVPTGQIAAVRAN